MGNTTRVYIFIQIREEDDFIPLCSPLLEKDGEMMKEKRSWVVKDALAAEVAPMLMPDCVSVLILASSRGTNRLIGRYDACLPTLGPNLYPQPSPQASGVLPQV